MKEIEWRPNRESKTPLYVQIKQFILDKISAGEWYIDYRLPPQRELTEYFGVNRSTLKTALEDLVADGILKTKGKAGTFVKNNTWSLLSSDQAPDWKKYIDSGTLNSNRHITQAIHRYEFASDAIRLSTGELSPDLFPIDDINQIFRSLMKDKYNLNYEHQNGNQMLREELSKYYRELGIDVTPSQILIVSGGLQAIHLVSIGLLPRGTSIICEKPSYLTSLNIFASKGIHLKGVQSGIDGLHIKELEAIYYKSRNPICYLIPYFQNPTGLCMSDCVRRELLVFCRENRVPIIEDDSYRELYFNERRPLPLKSGDKNQSVIHVGSTSKTMAAGLRLGWMIGQEEVIAKLSDLKMQIDYGVSTISQIIFSKYLESGMYEKNLQRLRVKLKERRDYMLEILEEEFSSIAQWTKPDGGFYIWLQIIQDVDMEQIFIACAQKGVLINPGYMYDKDNRDGIRLSFAYASYEEMNRGLSILKEAIMTAG